MNQMLLYALKRGRCLTLRTYWQYLNIILSIVLLILVGLNYYIVHYDFEMPKQEGITWLPPLTVKMNHVTPDYSEKRIGPGENGEAVKLNGDEAKEGALRMKKWYMNVIASDKVSLDRSLPDRRNSECHVLYYGNDLPHVTIIIVFTDEAWSPLLRTVHSVVNRSPLEYIDEVLLVDDFSQQNELKGKLENYMKRFGGLVRLIRLKHRHGSVLAKIEGVKAAKSEVIMFLDPYCEATTGWLEPLLYALKKKRNSVVCPMLNPISAETLQLVHHHFQRVGGFTWDLHFMWDVMSENKRELLKYAQPIESPTISSGIFAINRDYFLKIGLFDPTMKIRDDEDLQLSFKVWMCGGSIEFIPCSVVGRIFRNVDPARTTGRNDSVNVQELNSKRLAEVWMDDYRRLFYYYKPYLKTRDVGDISEKIALRRRLHCKSFKWYLENVISYKFVLDENVVVYGAVMNRHFNKCLDTLGQNENAAIKVGLFACQSSRSSNQLFSVSHNGGLRREMTCVDNQVDKDGLKGIVRLIPCQKSKSQWTFKDDVLKHVKSGLCLDYDGHAIVTRKCGEGKEYQKWNFVKFFDAFGAIPR